MEQVRSQDAPEWREGRRLRAWELKQRGWKQRDIATALGVTQGAVSHWLSRARDGGRMRVPPGRGAGAGAAPGRPARGRAGRSAVLVVVTGAICAPPRRAG